MRTLSQLLLTFLLNSLWQVALIAALAAISSWLLRDSSARYRHWVWVAALFLSVGVPWINASDIMKDLLSQPQLVQIQNEAIIPPLVAGNTPVELAQPLFMTDVFLLSQSIAWVLALAYFAFVLYGSVRLCRAFLVTRRVGKNLVELRDDKKLTSLIERCALAIAGSRSSVRVCVSEIVPVPITIGILRPVIILPKSLLSEASDEVLMSAIGHELIHVRRRDYAFNLLYEILFLLLSFHPAAALIRRRIKQTRELSCDELVAERILNAEVYARSLVQLASAAPTFRRLSVTTTVGIADADILEVRVMSLLKRQKFNSRWKNALLALVALLLFIPSLAASSLATKFGVKQATVSQDQEQKEKEKEKVKERRQSRESEVGYAVEEDQKRKAETDDEIVMLRRHHQEEELKAMAAMQATLIRLARIPMDQAILIATSQYPGKVLECSLNGDRWEELGKLAKDGHVFYHVVILSSDDTDAATNHVLVNAIDGTILKAEKELPRKMRSPERP